MNDKFKRALSLFATFFKIGLFTFGGGYAMIPLIEKEIVEKKKWITSDDILEVFAISESTPGPIAINSATFVGYKTAGFFGALFATLGVVLPSFTIIFILSFFIEKFKHLKAVEYAFNGIRAGVIALVIKALITMIKKCPKNAISYIIASLAFLVTVIFDLNVFIVIIACAVVGLIYHLIITSKKRGNKNDIS